MAKLSNCFEQFLSEIRPTQNQKEDLKKGHTLLRNRLHGDEKLNKIIVSTFLQGSYRRGTLVRPKGDERSDVDVVVVTKLKKEDYQDPDKAMNLFVPFLRMHYNGKWRRQTRSFGIELSYVDLDLVISCISSSNDMKIYESQSVIGYDTAEESEIGDKWKADPLWIPDRKLTQWKRTHPLEQIKWVREKNKNTNGHYTNVVKAIKWWHRLNYPDVRPKGYPLEYLIGDCCPNGIDFVAEGIVTSLENIVNRYRYRKPYLPAPGVPEQDVFANIDQNAFSEFYECVVTAAETARDAYDEPNSIKSSERWKELFGDKFPKSGKDKDENGSPKGPFLVASSGDREPRRYGSK